MDPYNDEGLIQRLRNAVEALDRAEPIQERLRFAYQNYLVALQPDDFPEHRREDFRALEEACTWLPAEANQQGTIESTFEHMTTQEAQRWAGVVRDLFNDLSTGAGRS